MERKQDDIEPGVLLTISAKKKKKKKNGRGKNKLKWGKTREQKKQEKNRQL